MFLFTKICFQLHPHFSPWHKKNLKQKKVTISISITTTHIYIPTATKSWTQEASKAWKIPKKPVRFWSNLLNWAKINTVWGTLRHESNFSKKRKNKKNKCHIIPHKYTHIYSYIIKNIYILSVVLRKIKVFNINTFEHSSTLNIFNSPFKVGLMKVPEHTHTHETCP